GMVMCIGPTVRRRWGTYSTMHFQTRRRPTGRTTRLIDSCETTRMEAGVDLTTTFITSANELKSRYAAVVDPDGNLDIDDRSLRRGRAATAAGTGQCHCCAGHSHDR